MILSDLLPDGVAARQGRNTPPLHTLHLATLLALAVCVLPIADAAAKSKAYSNGDLRGEWVWSGWVRFGAPVPFPALLVDGAPPQEQVAPGEVVGVWGAILGVMSFDGKGLVSNENVFKPGELQPLSPPFPLPFVPPLPEVSAGSYQVSNAGTVQMQLSGRSPASPEGQIDFNTDFSCVLNRKPLEMHCVFSRFQTFAVDPNGYHAPITGILTFTRRH